MAGPLFPTDFRVIREYPLMNIDNENHIVLDLQFLAELLFSGLFFQLLFSLPTEKR